MAEPRYTAEQQRVIEHAGGSAVIAAVAGSGKAESLIGLLRHMSSEVDGARPRQRW